MTSDLGRLREAVRLATRTDDEEERVALLRPALELIEGRPVSRTTSGWGWWSSYEAQASAAASDAAQMLAPILAARGDAEGARWAIDRARLVDDYSEELYRVAMRCAGLCGDSAWARARAARVRGEDGGADTGLGSERRHLRGLPLGHVRPRRLGVARLSRPSRGGRRGATHTLRCRRRRRGPATLRLGRSSPCSVGQTSVSCMAAGHH